MSFHAVSLSRFSRCFDSFWRQTSHGAISTAVKKKSSRFALLLSSVITMSNYRMCRDSSYNVPFGVNGKLLCFILTRKL